MSKVVKKRRVFSESFKKEKITMIERGDLRICDLCRLYAISSSLVHAWKKKYGNLPPTDVIVIEKDSDFKKSLRLTEKIKDLEQMVGRQQMELDYFTRLIKNLNAHFEYDVEKKFC